MMTPPPIESLVPHRPPMLWVESVLECTTTETKALARFTADHFAVSNRAVAESALVECMAQTVAAGEGLRASQEGRGGKARGGMLVSVSNFTIYSTPPLNQPLEILIKEVKRLGPMLLISGTVTWQGEVIASGELSLYA